MEYLLLIGFFNTLWIVGVKNAFDHGQAFGALGDWMAGSKARHQKAHLPEVVTKPLIVCPPCMASFHGVLFWLIFQPVPWYFLPLYVVCLSGLMKITSILILNKDTF